MTEQALVNLTAPQFTELMKTQGLEQTVRGVLEIANDEIETQGQPLTLEALTDGTHPLLDKLDRYKGLAPEDRNISQEEILTLFTNVEDFGKYDPQKDTTGRGAAFASGAVRAVPEAVGLGAGFKAGLAAGVGLQSFVPTLPVLFPVKGLVLAASGVGGSILGAIAAGEAEDAVFGEAAPVVPSLRRPYAAGETLTYGASLLATPYKLISSVPKAKTGALEFIEQFAQVAKKEVNKDNFLTFAKNAGFSQKRANKIYDQAMKAREARSKGQQMFGGEYGINLGFTRFNPSGRMFDPMKGPATARAVGAVEKGIEKSLTAARANPEKFFALEGISAAGASAGAALTDPYDPMDRMAGEVIGSLFPPLFITVGFQAAPAIFQTIKSWWGTKDNVDGLMTNKMEEKATENILTALRRSEEYQDTIDPETKEVVQTGEEKLQNLIDELFKAGEEESKRVQSFNAKNADAIAAGEIDPMRAMTSADLARANNLPFNKTLTTIQQELARTSDDLAMATGRGREQMQTGAVFAIRALAATGDPNALNMAARITQTLMEQNLLDQIDTASTKLFDSATRVLGREADAGSQRINLSKQLYEVLDEQIKRSKQREKQLWNDVGNYRITEFYAKNGQQINEPNILKILDRPSRQGGLKFSSKGTQANFNSALGKYSDDIDDLRSYFRAGEGRNPATAQRLFEMRGGLLNIAAKAKAAGDRETSRHINTLADAVLRYLTGMRNHADEAYNMARAYTYARNNVFTRTFLSDLQQTGKDRGLVMDPKFLLDEAFEGSRSQAAQNFADMKAAGRFLYEDVVDRQGNVVVKAGYPEEEIVQMGTDDIIALSIRDFMGKVVDKKQRKNPVTGKTEDVFVVNPTKLANEQKQPGYEILISNVDGLADDLADAQTAQKTFDNLLGDVTLQMNPTQAKAKFKYTDDQINRMYGTKAFQSILENENPKVAVAQAIDSKHPVKSLNALFRLVERANLEGTGYNKTQAQEGLKQAIFSYAVENAATSNKRLSGDVLQRDLFDRIPNAPPDSNISLSSFMIDKGLVTEKQMAEVQQNVKIIKGVEEAFATGDFEQVLFKKPSLAKLFYVRLAGATAGGAVQNKMKQVLGLPQLGGGLIAESTGSEMVQRLLLQAPEAQRNKILVGLFSNPEALSAAMKTIKTAQDEKNAMNVLEKFARPFVEQTGKRTPTVIRTIEQEVRDVDTEEPSPEEEANRRLQEFTPQASLQPVPRFMDFESRQLQGAATPPTMSPPPAAPSPAPTGPVDRSQYAALFPSDIASGLIRQQQRPEQQGIGSLV
jgi:hypothetical protein